MKKIASSGVKTPRKNCHDIWWNAFMVRGANFNKKYDIPDCPTTAKGNPRNIITYSEAKSIYKKELAKGSVNVYAFMKALSSALPKKSLTVVSNGACCVAGHQAYVICAMVEDRD